MTIATAAVLFLLVCWYGSAMAEARQELKAQQKEAERLNRDQASLLYQLDLLKRIQLSHPAHPKTEKDLRKALRVERDIQAILDRLEAMEDQGNTARPPP